MARSTNVPEQIPDAVERQVSAYNAGDLEGFLLCVAEDVVVEDAEGNVRSGGPSREARAIAIYHLDGDGLIDRARFIA